MKKGISFFLSVVLLLTLLPGSAYAAESGMGNFQRNGSYYTGLFTDVPADAWYADGVAAGYELGLMVGSGQKTFSPRRPSLPMARSHWRKPWQWLPGSTAATGVE